MLFSFTVLSPMHWAGAGTAGKQADFLAAGPGRSGVQGDRFIRTVQIEST